MAAEFLCKLIICDVRFCFCAF